MNNRSYKKIKVSHNASVSTEYEAVVTSYVREEAAKTIQSYGYRRLMSEETRQKRSEKKQKHINKKNKINYLTEIDDQKFNQELQALVQQNQYQAINYNHPNFKQHLFSALRFGLIDRYQLLNVQLMHESLLAFNQGKMPSNPAPHFKRFTLNTGPFCLSKQIKYWREKEARALQAYMEDPQSHLELHYYTINLLPFQTAYLLIAILEYHGNVGIFSSPDKALKSETPYSPYAIFDKYIRALNISNLEKSTAYDIINDADNPKSYDQLIAFIKEHTPVTPEMLSQVEQGSIKQLSAWYFAKTEFPGLCISPDYDPTHPVGSPILSMIILPINTLITLQKILFGSEATLPEPVVNRVTTRMLRAADEPGATNSLSILYPEASLLTVPARYVELTHPLVEKEVKSHGMYGHDFFFTWHDLYHIWRNSSYDKSLMRALRRLHDEKGGFAIQTDGITNAMCKARWELTDLGFSHGENSRYEYNNPLQRIDHLIKLGGFNFSFNHTSKSYNLDDNYLLIYALCTKPDGLSHILNPNLWSDPNEFSHMMAKKNQMETYLKSHPNASVVQIILYDLLAPYHNEYGDLLDILDDIEFKKILFWSTNNGLYFTKYAQKLLPTLLPSLRQNSHQAILTLLAMQTQRITSRNHEGNTALHLAVTDSKEFTEQFHCLSPEQRSASLMIKNYDGNNVLHLASTHLESLIALLNQLSVETYFKMLPLKNLEGNTALHLASHHSDCFAELSDRLSVESSSAEQYFEALMIQNNQGNTVLHHASHHKDSLIEALDRLSETQCFQALTFKNNEGNTVLHQMIHQRDDLVEILDRIPVEHYYDTVTTQNNEGNTLLHHAIEHLDCSIEILKEILNRLSAAQRLQALTSIRNKNGHSVLYLAAAKPHIFIALFKCINLENRLEAFNCTTTTHIKSVSILDLVMIMPQFDQVIACLSLEAWFHFLIKEDLNGHTQIHRMLAQKPDCLSMILNSLPADKWEHVINLKDTSNKSLMLQIAATPYSLIVVLRSMPEDHRFNLLMLKNDDGERIIDVAVNNKSQYLPLILKTLSEAHRIEVLMTPGRDGKRLFDDLGDDAIPTFERAAKLTTDSLRKFGQFRMVKRELTDVLLKKQDSYELKKPSM